MSPLKLRTLSLLAIMKRNISIQACEIPFHLYMEIQNLKKLVVVRKEKAKILDKEKRIHNQLDIEEYECDLYYNMLLDSTSDNEEWNYYVFGKFAAHSSLLFSCEEEEEKIKKEKERNNDEEKNTLKELYGTDYSKIIEIIL